MMEAGSQETEVESKELGVGSWKKENGLQIIRYIN